VASSDGRVAVRSFSLVFRLERRLYRFDRWRIPLPTGLPVRALAYAAVCWGLAYAASRTPVLGWALGALPVWAQWGTLPGLAVFALLRMQIDGRAPHRALAGALRWQLSPRVLSGLRPCPPPGAELVPLGEVAVRPDWRATRYRPGRVTGPARLLLRYPAAVAIEEEGGGEGVRLAGRRLRVGPRPGPALTSGRTLDVPADAEVVFE
jgi:hypothetical protein